MQKQTAQKMRAEDRQSLDIKTENSAGDAAKVNAVQVLKQFGIDDVKSL